MSKPARQSDRAVARPIPRLAPVTKANRLNILSPQDLVDYTQS
jgi:hypothetical protein